MILADILLGARDWLWVAIVLGGAAVAALAWTYGRGPARSWLRATCALLKGAGIALLLVCLVEPMYVGTRPRPGSNLFLVVADNSRSLQLADRTHKPTRGAAMQSALANDSAWLSRLAQDFEVRKYAFDRTLVPVDDFEKLTLEGEASSLASAIKALADRYEGKPVAGILLLSDGNATDLPPEGFDARGLPPIYPVSLTAETESPDLAVTQVAVTQTNFEAAPVTIAAEFATQGLAGQKVVLRVIDEEQKEVERRVVTVEKEGERLAERFLIRPERPGVSFYDVVASLDGEEALSGLPARSKEATLANNRRIATVDRGGGPYRVLYVGGAPNWEFKFLRRALAADDEVDVAGLVRIAKKEPKFAFRDNDERTNPLFRGFDNVLDEKAEQYDEPVLLRLGTKDRDELRVGFPNDAADLYPYHAVILDDVEADFFTKDQLSLLQRFVSQRGGGLLMMGGKGSFVEGGYARTPVAEMLPVYLDRAPPATSLVGYRLRLTREGWLQPWVRVRSNQEEELQRLASMPALRSLNAIEAIKPGASVLAEVESTEGATRPALVVQPFGRGRVGALLLGDLWRWHLRRPDPAESDLEKSWRQTVRWLVADVPQPVEVETRKLSERGLASIDIVVRARDKEFAPLDNAAVKLAIRTPDNRQIELIAEASDAVAGEYHARFTPRVAGAYRAQATVTAADGSEVGRRDLGWAVEPETDEFQRLAGNRALLERLAADSGGEVVELRRLGSFVRGLPNRKIPIVENWTYPLWHQWSVLAAAMGCLVAEWGLRRWRGMP